MSSILQDRLLFITLLVVGTAWALLSYETIPAGFSGSSLSPQTFPLGLGLVLIALVLFGWIGVEMRHRRAPDPDSEDSSDSKLELWAAVSTFGFLAVYFIALHVLGFMPATILTVAAFLILVLKERSPLIIGGLSIGLSLGLYLLMRVLLGVYLPPGMFGWGF